MEPDLLNAFTEVVALNQLQEEDIVPGEKRKCIKASSLNDPKLEALQKFLIEWINTTLKHEHIVVKSLEQDLYDGLILHHLLEKLGSLTLEVENIALTERKQRLKLAIILKTLNECLHLEESKLKWSVDAIFKKDLLSTLHLLVAIIGHFQPELAVPPNVHVDVVITECTLHGLKTENEVEYITKSREAAEDASKAEIFDELLKHAPEKLDAVKEVFLKFVNRHIRKLGITVKDANSQVHNVNLAVDLLLDGGLLNTPINPEDIVNQDMKATLLILYCLYCRYKTKDT
ncbi:gamma-parvin isoform X2 [Hemicordylus capensis]|uniref:gamma-parvin isoform X2 n=1 Tax=Hemicordylus capensis TaxID=884348 RepID=UPI002304CB59|nr:gamma-parvin isoform X2 [Hemicordylus capensis]